MKNITFKRTLCYRTGINNNNNH